MKREDRLARLRQARAAIWPMLIVAVSIAGCIGQSDAGTSLHQETRYDAWVGDNHIGTLHISVAMGDPIWVNMTWGGSGTEMILEANYALTPMARLASPILVRDGERLTRHFVAAESWPAPSQALLTQDPSDLFDLMPLPVILSTPAATWSMSAPCTKDCAWQPGSGRWESATKATAWISREGMNAMPSTVAWSMGPYALELRLTAQSAPVDWLWPPPDPLVPAALVPPSASLCTVPCEPANWPEARSLERTLADLMTSPAWEQGAPNPQELVKVGLFPSDHETALASSASITSSELTTVAQFREGAQLAVFTGTKTAAVAGQPLPGETRWSRNSNPYNLPWEGPEPRPLTPAEHLWRVAEPWFIDDVPSLEFQRAGAPMAYESEQEKMIYSLRTASLYRDIVVDAGSGRLLRVHDAPGPEA